MSLTYVTRSGWGARKPSSPIPQTTWDKRTGFVVHHGGIPIAVGPAPIRGIQNHHMDTNGWSDIGYNWLVDNNGVIYEGRGWLGIGAHTANHNTATIGVCWVGNSTFDIPSPNALEAIHALYVEACKRSERMLEKSYHSRHNPTACPGVWLTAWVESGMELGTNMNANELWSFRGIDYVNPSKPTTKNHQVARAHEYSYEAVKILRRQGETLAAILAAVSGDNADAIKSLLDSHHDVEMAEFARLASEIEPLHQALTDIRELVGDAASGKLAAEDVINELVRRLNVGNEG